MRLQDIPGVGPRLRERLLSHFGSEEMALRAIADEDMEDLRAAIGERQAIATVRAARGLRYHVSPESFLATDEAERIYRAVLNRMAEHANTAYARMRIATLFPSGSPELINEMRSLSLRALDLRRRLGDVGDLLRRIKPLRRREAQRIKGRAILARSPEELERVRSMGFDRLLDVHLAESPGELRDIASGYDHVIVLSDPGASLPGVEIAERLEAWYIAPEAVLSFYTDNRDALEAGVELAALLDGKGIEHFEDLDVLRDALRRLFHDTDSPDISRIDDILRRSPEAIDSALAWANTELRQRIEASSVTLGGQDLLRALGRGDMIRDVFEMQMQGIFKSVISDARARVASDLNMRGGEAIWLEEIIPQEIKYPIEINHRALRQLELELRRRRESYALRIKREIARSLASMDVTAANLIKRLMQLDFLYAIGSFALSCDLRMPELIDAPAIGFRDGRHLFIQNPEPVSYSLGSCGISEHTERGAILSGVNSGGKTSLLELIAQIAILAQMGLPVPASECRVSIFEELYFFAKSSGTLSAGAFESTMRKLSAVATERRKLVLADEMEAITEPGASARIIASILDMIHENGSVALFVSHLADEIRRFSKTTVRVDGIEAEGLDDNNNLILTRSPRYNHLARSTPELILDRLVRTTEGEERIFYESLLTRFRNTPP
ncbi:MutS-related protein [Methanothrix sp.]|uniref:MutS-related protein n=1 Tax=Methanothrix sp. TaxID=90426 RepID=UPI002BED4BAA|nr:helix-hairpin-helix domain-containing protein [Methanothrix sp.]HOK58282.1 DNA mismatch repair protein MutS [Methanothrix sp.]HOL43606.1 DNA mismatch repair protein MutS [Methanothrix sp.]HPO89081.1 DNA mismatch repair protein MutS [Methanothrix sp.]